MNSSESYASEALAGFSKGAVYDQHRPSYPPQAVDDLLQALRLNASGGSPANVLDLAAGTGKFTELLARRPEQFEIVAVEPNAGMRLELDKKRLPKVTVLDGLATQIPTEDERFDAVIAAQVSRLHRLILSLFSFQYGASRPEISNSFFVRLPRVSRAVPIRVNTLDELPYSNFYDHPRTASCNLFLSYKCQLSQRIFSGLTYIYEPWLKCDILTPSASAVHFSMV